MSPADADLPNVDPAHFERPAPAGFGGTVFAATHPPRFLLLYGSLRERSYSRLLTLEAARLLRALGGETRVFAAYYERVVDVMEELVKLTLLTRDVAPCLVDRYSERREAAEALARRVGQRSI